MSFVGLPGVETPGYCQASRGDAASFEEKSLSQRVRRMAAEAAEAAEGLNGLKKAAQQIWRFAV
jgi:hypothetical protein